MVKSKSVCFPRDYGLGGKKAKGAESSSAPLEEPDTQEQLLPLLPFRPDGIGSVHAARLLKEKSYLLIKLLSTQNRALKREKSFKAA